MCIRDSNEWWAAQLIESGYKSDELLAYIEKEIKLGESNLKQDNQEGKLVDVPGIFDYVLQAIRHQVSKGEKFVFVGLTSPERRVRNGSVTVSYTHLVPSRKQRTSMAI